MTDLKAIIFDVDGTLAETEDAHRRAFNKTFTEFGLGWRWTQGLYRELLKVSGGKERIKAFAPATDDALVARLHGRKTELYTAEVAAGMPFRPGIARLIEEARAAGLRLAVATTTTRANVLALLDGATGGAGHQWFEMMACADDAPTKKPDPLVYRLVLERMGLAGHECLAVEDSTNGVRAATGAGIPVVVTESVYTIGDDFTGALAVLSDLGNTRLDSLKTLHAHSRG